MTEAQIQASLDRLNLISERAAIVQRETETGASLAVAFTTFEALSVPTRCELAAWDSDDVTVVDVRAADPMAVLAGVQ